MAWQQLTNDDLPHRDAYIDATPFSRSIFFDPEHNDHHQPSSVYHPLETSLEQNEPSAKRARTETQLTADECRAGRYVEPYPAMVAENLGTALTPFQERGEALQKSGLPPWAPFEDTDEWELVNWLINRVNKTGTDEFLKLGLVSPTTHLVTHAYSFFKKIDTLPAGSLWHTETFSFTGDLLDENGEPTQDHFELWYRNSLQCVEELISNPMFEKYISYVPECIYEDSTGNTRVYDEMWTADWWWEMQDKIPSGGVMCPVILASDKTQLSGFSGGHQAYPLYLTLRNISKSVRRKSSNHAVSLIGYIPTSEITCFSDPQIPKYRLFHACLKYLNMKKILEPLKSAGSNRTKLICADGVIRRIFPILAAYVGNHPEQCLVAGCKENRCPICTVPAKSRGDGFLFPLRSQLYTEQVLHLEANGHHPPEFSEWGLRKVFSPFWAGMPHTDIFMCISPDILHQLFLGVFCHLLEWCAQLMGAKHLDECFEALPVYSGLKHFKHGVSNVSKWTGWEYHDMSRSLLGVISGSVDPRVVLVARALLDFITYAGYRRHTTKTLLCIEQALEVFHSHKCVLIDLGVHEHFNIPKVHSMQHYVAGIKCLGSADGFNMESSERLHIDYSKRAFKASNHRDYIMQMARWIQRQEAMFINKQFLAWSLKTSSPESESTNMTACFITYSIAKKPPHYISVRTLAMEYNAPDFVNTLQDFLQKIDIPGRFTVPNVYDWFNIYKLIHINWSATMDSDIESYHVNAFPERPNSGHGQRSGSKFDTILVTESGNRPQTSKGFQGLRLAWIHVIFELPKHLGAFPHPLAYIHWFRPFTNVDPTTHMHQVVLSTRNHMPYSEVISMK
ncbi:hypothetical protein F5148DRAFT_975813 [Russula earlei]|uniref:Uncharacterized protein n=1 Tax=Russula earlei TaxID=71964 RepID=A0ACC0UJ08_9AGAM|nr:hypothetical protein F5148DRAFT_975813 [Russula earlei]